MTVNANGILESSALVHCDLSPPTHIDDPGGTVLSPTLTSASNRASTSLGRAFGSCHTSHATLTGPIRVSSLTSRWRLPVTTLSKRLRDIASLAPSETGG